MININKEYEAVNAKLKEIYETSTNGVVALPHSDQITKLFLKDNLITKKSDYTASLSFFELDKFAISEILNSGGYPRKSMLNSHLTNQQVNVNGNISGNISFLSDSENSSIQQSNKIKNESSPKNVRDIIIGLIVTVVGGLILYFIIN